METGSESEESKFFFWVGLIRFFLGACLLGTGSPESEESKFFFWVGLISLEKMPLPESSEFSDSSEASSSNPLSLVTPLSKFGIGLL